MAALVLNEVLKLLEFEAGLHGEEERKEPVSSKLWRLELVLALLDDLQFLVSLVYSVVLILVLFGLELVLDLKLVLLLEIELDLVFDLDLLPSIQRENRMQFQITHPFGKPALRSTL